MIGSQRWMAENLNYAGATGDTGSCYNDSPDSCAKYGRLYTWSQLMKGQLSSAASPSGIQGLCPTGWHIPSDAEWDTLMNAVGGVSDAGTMLKSTGGWYNAGNGTDSYGFRALPGGYVYGGSSNDIGNYGNWWSATEYTTLNAWYRDMYYGGNRVNSYDASKAYRYSARCLEDN